MKSEGTAKYVAFSVLGFLVMAAGFLLAIFLPGTDGFLRILPYICIGAGAGAFGGNFGNAVREHIIKKNPGIARKIEIETNDERNMAITGRAKAKAYEIMQVLLWVLTIVFALLQADLYVILSLVAVNLIVIFSMLYYIDKYNKEM